MHLGYLGIPWDLDGIGITMDNLGQCGLKDDMAIMPAPQSLASGHQPGRLPKIAPVYPSFVVLAVLGPTTLQNKSGAILAF